MAVLAVAVFVVAYALIASDRINKTLVALGGAAIVVAVGVVGSADVFYSHDTGIDWDVIFLLLGMMIIVSVLRQTGVFEYVAIWSAKRAKGSPLRIMILLVLVTAVASALLDNVTTVLLIAPVTLLVCDRLAINPVPLSVLGTPVKVGVHCRFCCWPCRHPCLVAVGGRGAGSRWSARSAARTNDLDAGADPAAYCRSSGGRGEKCCDSNHVMPPRDLREAIEGGKGRASAQPYLGPRTSVRRHDDGWGARRAGW